ncbi:MAG TPA: serine hydrolase [Desulfobacteria bacterium]|nr:serine hydrolase [Desulfobacteria bacterium]
MSNSSSEVMILPGRVKDLTTVAMLLAIGAFVVIMMFSPRGIAKPTISDPVQTVDADLYLTQELQESRLVLGELNREKERVKLAEQNFDEKLNLLKDKITSYLAAQNGIYGFELMIDVDFGLGSVTKTIGNRQGESFKMASTFKLPVVFYLCSLVSQGKVSFEDKFVYSPDCFEEGTGSLQYKAPGGKYSARELARLALRQSDNVAVNILIKNLGRDNINQFMKSLGGTGIPPEGTPYGTPHDLAIYMKATQALALTNPSLGGTIIEDLQNTVFNDRIRAGIPGNIAVAHKIGNLGGVVNDIGLVQGQQPYILAVMSRNIPDDRVAADVIKQAAKLTWEVLGNNA